MLEERNNLFSLGLDPKTRGKIANFFLEEEIVFFTLNSRLPFSCYF